MLVLSRKKRESVVVGGSTGFERLLKVTVLEINGGKVRLGFEVDSGVRVQAVKALEGTCDQSHLTGAKPRLVDCHVHQS